MNFSVTNFRSITKAHKINLQNLTILVGKNNEGKSNFLRALNIAMNTLMRHGNNTPYLTNRHNINLYKWEKDFPIQLQSRKSGLESIFKLEFKLEEDELSVFHQETKIRGNENIPITIKISKTNLPKIEVPKRGSSAYNKKSSQIADFISKRLSFNYIQAIRTEEMALQTLNDVITQQLYSLTDNPEYTDCINKINELQQEVLNGIADKLIEPLKSFLPEIQNIKITKRNYDLLHRYRNEIDIIIDDGTPTNISYKGDGIKSLATLAILKNRTPLPGASIIAIEEPESHLHSGAIHGLVNVIKNLSEKNQVIITTHNPLFVQQNKIKSNIIIDSGTAQPAKSISEIRKVLGVWSSDNLKNANFVLLVEGEDDKIALNKIFSAKSKKISECLANNSLVIKPLGGASNLSHELYDLKNCMCKYFVLLDNDEEGIKALDKALERNLLTEANYKLTICNGSPDSEFEDCLNPQIYKEVLLNDYQIDITNQEFRNNKKWSDRIKNIRLSQGGRWTDAIEKQIKLSVADAIPEKIDNIADVLIEQKSGFLFGLVESLERMIDSFEK